MRTRVVLLIMAAALALTGAATDPSGPIRGPGQLLRAYLPLVCRRFELVPTTTPTPTPDLTATLLVSKLVDRGEAAPGSVLHYILVVMNDMLSGEDPGTYVTLEDALPPELELVPGSLHGAGEYDATTRTIRWTGSIARGGSIGLDFQALMTGLAASMRSVSNTVVVTDAFGRVREASAHTHVLFQPPQPALPWSPRPHTPQLQPACRGLRCSTNRRMALCFLNRSRPTSGISRGAHARARAAARSASVVLGVGLSAIRESDACAESVRCPVLAMKCRSPTQSRRRPGQQ